MIRRILRRLFSRPRPHAPAVIPFFPEYLRRHAEAQDAGIFSNQAHSR